MNEPSNSLATITSPTIDNAATSSSSPSSSSIFASVSSNIQLFCQSCLKTVQFHASFANAASEKDESIAIPPLSDAPTTTPIPLQLQAGSSTSAADEALLNELQVQISKPEASELDHPLCGECTQSLINSLSMSVREIQRQEITYTHLFDQLEKEHRRHSQSEDELLAEIAALQAEEADVVAQFEEIENERELIRRETQLLETESKKLSIIEERYWESHNAYQRDLQGYQEARDGLKMKILYTDSQLHKLMKTNAFNDTFHIWHDGHFGTINSFRLGRLPSQPVDWNEINAAWGQAALLLYTMAQKLRFKFSAYVIHPIGSFSKIERIEDGSKFDLFGSSDISLGRLFWYRRFESAMVGYLRCLKDLGDYAQSQESSFQLPYKINQDAEKIGDMSIKIQFNNDQQWTKALKFLLIDLKCLLAWVSKMEAR